jgi:hypothetical protein
MYPTKSFMRLVNRNKCPLSGSSPPIDLNLHSPSPHRPDRQQISLDVSPDWSDECEDRNPVRRNANEQHHCIGKERIGA